jgi:hypothetical protein
MVLRRLILVVLVLALVVLVPTAIAGSAKQRPFHASIQGHTTTIVFANPANPLAESHFGGRCLVPSNWVISFEGIGHATHLGRFTWSSSHCTHVDALPPAEVIVSGGQFEYVAANGDRLFEVYAGAPISVATPTQVCVDTIGGFTGGTGRFVHASGVVLERGCWNPQIDPGPALRDLRITSTGTIAY